MKNKISGYIKAPIVYILLGSFVLFSLGIFWGLPNNESWLSDSLAPFHPLIGLSQLFSFGYLNKYPLVHQFFLAVLNLPVIIIALINSNPLEGFEFMKFMTLLTTPSYATALIIIDRITSLVMGVLSVYVIYKIGLELFNKRIAVISSIIVALNPLINFYSHLAKVEVPYMFWGLCAFYMLIRIIKYDETRSYKYAAIFACLCFGTKDQGYALFVLPFIYIFIVHKIKNRTDTRTVIQTIFSRKNIIFLAYFFIFAILVQNILFNFEGFLYRFNILTGWNVVRSQSYTLNFIGIITQLWHSILALKNIMTIPVLICSLCGIVLIVIHHKKIKGEYSKSLLLLLASISYYIFFLQIARQTSFRQLMPISIFLTLYAGYAIHYIIELFTGKKQKLVAYTIVCLFGLYALYHTASTNYFMMNDLRYSVEKWMNKHITKDSVIEYYSYLHYLPRFPADTDSYRIKQRVLEIETRKPDYIILTSHYYRRYMGRIVKKNSEGKVITTQKRMKFLTSDFPKFFNQLFNNKLNYRLLKRFNKKKSFFKNISHARVSPDHIMIYKRQTENE